MIVNTEKLFIENLEIYTSTVKSKSNSGKGKNKKIELYGIQKLRELILQLAMQGKLLQQDKNDESANKLLEKINYERQSLIKSKKIKNHKCSITNDSWSSIKLPSSWELTTLGIIADWGSGSTPKRENPNYYGGGNTWLKSGELNDCQDLKGSSERITEEAINAGSFRENNIGDVLVAMYGATIGKTAILAEKAYTNQAVCGCTPFNGIFNRYLFFYLLSQRKNFNAASEGGAQPNISRVKLLGFPFPLPPIAEQHRIVAKVNELMELCDQLEQVQLKNIETHNMLVTSLLKPLISATADPTQIKEAWINIQKNFNNLFISESSINRLKKVILQLAVMGKLVKQNIEDKKNFSPILDKEFIPSSEIIVPFKVPYKWDWKQLKELANVNGGFAFSSGNFVKDGTRVIRISDFDEGGFKKNKIVRHEISDELEKYKLKEGDILLAMTGGTVGKSLHVESIDEPMLVNQRVATIRAGRSITSEYLNIVIKSELTQDVIFKSKNSTNDNISMKDINSFLVPLPPIAEQHRIVSKVNQLLLICDQIQSLLVKAQSTQINFANTLVGGNIS